MTTARGANATCRLGVKSVLAPCTFDYAAV